MKVTRHPRRPRGLLGAALVCPMMDPLTDTPAVVAGMFRTGVITACMPGMSNRCLDLVRDCWSAGPARRLTIRSQAGDDAGCLLPRPIRRRIAPGTQKAGPEGPPTRQSHTACSDPQPAAKQVRVLNRKPRPTNRRLDPLTKITGARAGSLLPPHDTPRDAEGSSPRRDGLPHAPEPAQNARAAWRSVTPLLAGTPHVRVSRDGGRTYPARHARALPARSAGPPAGAPPGIHRPGRQRC
jgi:hypothetical protein